MNAITALYSPGRYRVPYAGGPTVAFLASQITHIGRISTYGDNVIRYLVRVEGSAEIYFVKPSVCEKSDRRFLEQARDLMKSFPSRDNPLVIVWMEVQSVCAECNKPFERAIALQTVCEACEFANDLESMPGLNRGCGNE